MYEERPSRLTGAVVWTRTAQPGHPVYPVLPDGCMDLLWGAGQLFVAGPDTHAYTPAGDRRAYAGVRFAPGTAPAFLGVPAHELRDRRVGLADLWGGARARQLAERLAAAADPVAELEAVALHQAERTRPPDPLLGELVRRLESGATVTAAADAVGLSTRQLHRRSLDAFGYGPKTLARVLRLQRALTLVRRGVPYADAAVGAGCVDQAHLAREMRDLVGTTLRAYSASATSATSARLANSETPQPSGSMITA